MRYGTMAIALVVAMMFLVTTSAVECPFSRYRPKDYSDVRISPIEKYVAEEIIFRIKDVSKEGEEFPAPGRVLLVDAGQIRSRLVSQGWSCLSRSLPRASFLS